MRPEPFRARLCTHASLILMMNLRSSSTQRLLSAFDTARSQRRYEATVPHAAQMLVIEEDGGHEVVDEAQSIYTHAPFSG
jgi:hypothetical protein